MNEHTRRQTVGAALGLSLAGCAGASGTTHPTDARRGRITVGVRLNDQGPFTFVIDSAANASVIADDLAIRLGLPRGADVGMHTLIAREVVGTVRAGRVQAGAMDVRDVDLAIGSRAGLAGVDGLLGTDLIRDLRLDVRFAGSMRARISPSNRSERLLHYKANVRVLRAVERRPDNLMVVRGEAGRADLHAIIDTGALVSVANGPLTATAPLFPVDLGTPDEREQVLSPTGRSAPAKAVYMPELLLGGVVASKLTILSGDFHTFGVWGLSDRPALLVGVDILRLFSHVSIDLREGELILEV